MKEQGGSKQNVAENAQRHPGALRKGQPCRTQGSETKQVLQLHWLDLEERAKGGLRGNQPSNCEGILYFILNDEKADLQTQENAKFNLNTFLTLNPSQINYFQMQI